MLTEIYIEALLVDERLAEVTLRIWTRTVDQNACVAQSLIGENSDADHRLNPAMQEKSIGMCVQKHQI